MNFLYDGNRFTPSRSSIKLLNDVDAVDYAKENIHHGLFSP